MSYGLNKVMLIGHLGKDPELSYTPSGVAVCKFSLATDESYKGEDGNKVDRTEWHNMVAWRKLGEICSTYLKKGSKIYAEGKIQTESYEKEGKKNYITKIIMSDMVMLDNKGGGKTPEIASATNGEAEVVSDKSNDNDLPF